MKSYKVSGSAGPRIFISIMTMFLITGTLTVGPSAVLRSDDTGSPQQFGLFDVVTAAQAQIQGPSAGAHLSGNGTGGDFTPVTRARALAVGDFNGDGIPDVVIGAPDATVSITAGMTTTTRAGAGSVFVFFGGAAGGPSSFPASPVLDTNQASVQILGANAGDHIGFSVAVGDVNGDGIDDIVIGATGFSANGTTRTNTGAAFVIFGSHSPAASIDLATTNAADVAILGIAHGDEFGTSLAIGNVGGSGAASAADQAVKDIFVGAPGFSGPAGDRAGAGGAFVIFGGSRLNRMAGATTVFDLSTPATPPDVEIVGKDAGDSLGASVAIGNINGGALGTLIAGAPIANRPASASVAAAATTGAVYGFQGGTNLTPGASLPKILDVATEQQNLSFYGEDTGDRAGYSVASGDVNGDGTADLLIGAPDASTIPSSQPPRTGAGECYILTGGARLSPAVGFSDRRIDAVVALTTPNDPANLVNVTVLGGPGDQLGTTVSAGVFNPPNFSGSTADVLIGSPGALSGAGSVSVLVGGPNLLVQAFRDNLLSQDDFRVTGRTGMNLGIAIAAGDINHDGAGDLLIGGPFTDVTAPAARAGAGTVFFLPGTTPAVTPSITVALTSPNGGDVLQVGESANINWTVTDPNGNNQLNRFQLLLSIDGGANFIFPVANNLPGTARTFAWVVPSGLNTIQGRIQINAFDSLGATGQAETAANFTITDLGVPVTLLTPTGTETLRFGQTFQITWSVPPDSLSRVKGFDLFLSLDGGLNFPTRLVSGPDPSQPALGPNLFSFNWTVPSICTTTAQVAVTATSTSNVRTKSSNGVSFAIKDIGPTVDTSSMSVDTSLSRAIFSIATPQQGAEVDFLGSTVVEISTDQSGTQFATFAKPFKLKKAGRKLITRGPINGQDLLAFLPNGAIRFIRFTNPTCAVTLLRVMRNNDQIVLAP